MTQERVFNGSFLFVTNPPAIVALPNQSQPPVSRLTKKKVALKCVSAFLNTNFSGGRHLRRIKKI